MGWNHIASVIFNIWNIIRITCTCIWNLQQTSDIMRTSIHVVYLLTKTDCPLNFCTICSFVAFVEPSIILPKFGLLSKPNAGFSKTLSFVTIKVLAVESLWKMASYWNPPSIFNQRKNLHKKLENLKKFTEIRQLMWKTLF